MDAYVVVKILKYSTGSSARSFQCKYAINDTFGNKSVESMEELGAAIKEVIQYQTIRGNFSSVHPELAAEGITRVEVGEEGLHFISDQQPGHIQHIDIPAPGNEDEDEMLRRAIAMSLEEQSREEEENESEEELLARALALSLVED